MPPTNIQDITDALQQLACEIAGRTITEESPATQPERVRIAAALGYIDSRTVVFFASTYGLPIEITLDKAFRDYGLRPDWSGLNAELQLQQGRDPERAQRMVEHLRREFELTHSTSHPR